LVALVAYFHPIYLAAVLINIVLVLMLWGRVATLAAG
jgi:hypothetical protein